MTSSRAMLLALVAFFLYSLYDAAIKFGQNPPVSPFLILATVGLTSAVCLISFASITGSLSTLRPKRLKEQSLVACSNVVMSLATIVALRHLPLTLFYVIIFLSPLVIALISTSLKHEVLTSAKVLCLVAGFAGTVLAIGVWDIRGDIVGYLAALFSVAGFCGRALFTRVLGKSVTPQSTLIVCNFLVGICGTVGFFLFPSDFYGFSQFLVFAFAGLMTAVGSTIYFASIQNTASTNVAQLHYTQIFFGTIFGFLIWNDIPSWNRLTGSAIIIASGVALAALEKKRTAKAAA